MGLREKLETFLVERCDIYPHELPKLFGTFFTVKYITWATFAIGGVRYRPMSKIFQQRVAPKVQKRMEGHKWLSDFHRYAGIKPSSSPLVRTASQLQPTKLFEKAGKWYQHYSFLYSTKLAKNDYWTSFSKLLRQDPRLFAVGLTEGLIFYKLTAPITIPATLYGIVKYYQRIRVEGEETIEEVLEDEDEDEDDLTGVEMFEGLKDIMDGDADEDSNSSFVKEMRKLKRVQ